MALSADRDTRESPGRLREPPMQGSTLIYQGAMVALNTSGRAVPAAATATLKVIGRAAERADNSAGGHAARRVRVERGIFRYGNSASSDLIAVKDIGANCYVVDDETVALTDNSSARPVAGRIYDVDALGVWVEFL